MKIFLLLILLTLSCDTNIFDSYEFEYEDVIINVTELRIFKGIVFSWLIAEGAIINIGNDTLFNDEDWLGDTWSIHGSFYSDSTFTEKFGNEKQRGDNLAPGDTAVWKLTHSNDEITLSDYPNFKVNNLKALIKTHSDTN